MARSTSRKAASLGALLLLMNATACSQGWWAANSAPEDKPLWLAGGKEKVRIGEVVSYRLRAQMPGAHWRLVPIAEGGYVHLLPEEHDILNALLERIGRVELLKQERFVRQNYVQEKYYKKEILATINKLWQRPEQGYAEPFVNKMQRLRERYYKAKGDKLPTNSRHAQQGNEKAASFVRTWLARQKQRLPVLSAAAVKFPSLKGLLSHQSEELGHWQLRFFKPGRYRPLAPAFFQKQKQQTGAKDTSSEYLALGIYAPKIKVVNPFGPKEKVAFQSMMPWQRPANGSLTLWLLILLVAAALVLAGLFWLILRQKGSRNQQRKRPRPSVEYFESMNAVKKELAQGDSDLMEVTVAMSRALRRFVERSLPIPAMERDAEELVRSLVHYAAQRDSVLAKAGLEKRVESLAQMLRYLDSIKFAKVEPHRPRLEEIAQELNSWVQKIAKYTEETSVAA